MKKQTDHEFASGFGKLVKGVSPLLLEEDQISDTLNMQPGFWWRQRKGMAERTAVAVASGLRWRSLAQFRDLQGNTDLLLAHTYDASGGEDIYKSSALPPNAITWTKLYDLTADCETCQWANVANAMVVANDKEILIWRGNQYKPSGVFFYKGSTDNYMHYLEEVTDGNPLTTLDLSGYDADAGDEVYIVSEQQLQKIIVDMGDVNAVMSLLKLHYWNGTAFTEITSRSTGGTFLDGTKKAGDPTVDEFTGAVINASLWNGPTGTMAAYMTQDDALIVETAFNGDAYIDTIGNVSYSGDFSIVGKLDCGGIVNGAGSDSNSMRLYIYKAGEYNTYCYFGRFARTGASETSHLSEIRTLGVRDDEQWTLVDPDEDQVTWYRIERIGSDLSTYWWSERTGVWTIEATEPSWTTDPVEIRIFSRMVNYTTWLGDPAFEYVRIGTPMNQDGEITWTPPADEEASSLQSIPGYVYKLVWPDDINGSIEELAVASPMGPVVDIWDGWPRNATGCYVYDGSDYTDYTIYVNNFVESQAADLSAATTSYAFYAGFAERMQAVEFWVTALAKNDANCQIDAVYYHDDTGAEQSVSFTDTTLDDALDSSFAQKGTVTWLPPNREDEKAVTIGGDTTPMYWYKFEWDATLADPTSIYYIRGTPVSEEIDPSYGCFAYKRRAWQLAPRNRENMVRFSAANLPNVWNGMDSGYVEFGERPLRAAAPFYNETIIYADTEMWMLQGNRPENFGRLRLSDRIGITAPQSLVSIESGVEINETLKIVLCWFYNDGIWMFDGVRIWKISAPDIDNFFDPDHEDYINPAYLDQTVGMYAFETQLAMWNVYSGATATTPTKTLVLHFPTMTYGIYQYGTELDAILSVLNQRHYVVAGGHDNGKFYQLDDGITDVNTGGTAVAVEAFVVTRDQFQSFSDGQKQRLVSVWAVSQDGGLLEIHEYPDGSETPQKIGEQSLQFLGKIFGAFQRNVKVWPGQKTSKFKFGNTSKTSRLKLIGHSTTVDRSRSNE